MQRAITILFFLSGATSLIYEVLWVRRLSLIFGHSIFSVSTVLTAFMSGLAIGSFLGGRWSDRKRADGREPSYFLSWYGKLELAIGLWAVLSLALLKGVEHVYLSYSSAGASTTEARFLIFVLSFLVLLPPTTAMGATLPIFTQALTSSLKNAGEILSKVYGFNTLGACFGCLVGGVFLLPNIGLRASILTGMLINIGIALAAFKLSSKFEESMAHEAEKDYELEDQHSQAKASPSSRFALPLVFGISGFCGMLYQLAWTRALILSLGSSTYSFSLILTAFLASLGFGSLVYKRLYSTRRPRLRDFALLQSGIAFSALLTTQLIGWLPLLKAWTFEGYVSSFLQVAIVDTLSVLVILGLPTLAMGLTFPLVTALYTTKLEELGKSLGAAYASNTVGAILGSFLGGFLLIPFIGAQTSAELAVACNLLGAGLLLVVSSDQSKKDWVFPAVALLGLIASPSWDGNLMSSGPSLYGTNVASVKPHFYRDGLSSTVSVRLRDGRYAMLAVNGKTDASIGGADDMTQLLLGLIPCSLHPDPQTVGVIGFGSGQTLVGVLSFPEVKKVICAEMEPAVLEASKFFKSAAQGYFEDPRLQIIEDDGRSFILGSSEEFDIILSEPSNPWIAGIGNLYTRDFYAGCKSKLRENGMMCQWFHTYLMTEKDLQMILRTFYSEFPEGAVYQIAATDLLLIGSTKEVQPDLERLSQLWETPTVGRWFYRFGLVDSNMFFATYLASRTEIIEYLGKAGDVPLNTDDKPLLEFRAPLAVFDRASIPASFFKDLFTNLVPDEFQGNPAVLQGSLLGRAILNSRYSIDADRALAEKSVEQKVDWYPALLDLVQETDAPAEKWVKVVEESPTWVSHYAFSFLIKRGKLEVASAIVDSLLSHPLPEASKFTLTIMLGEYFLWSGNPQLAKTYFLEAAELTSNERPYIMLTLSGATLPEKMAYAQKAVDRNPHSGFSQFLLGSLALESQDLETAQKALEESYRLYPHNPELVKKLTELHTKLGH